MKLAKACSLAIVIPVALVLVTFFVQNRHDVLLSFWPLSLRIHVPLATIMLGMLMIGVTWGGLAAWITAGKSRRRGREALRRTNQAEVTNRLLKEQVSRLEKNAQELNAANAPNVVEPSLILPPTNAA